MTAATAPVPATWGAAEWERLYRSAYAGLVGWLRYCVRDGDLAEDLAQEAFWWMRKAQPVKASPKTLLY
ncbi:MAG: hypothetical protein ACSLE3_10865, partial [Microbacteriaceae bacterium]